MNFKYFEVEKYFSITLSTCSFWTNFTLRLEKSEFKSTVNRLRIDHVLQSTDGVGGGIYTYLQRFSFFVLFLFFVFVFVFV